MSKPFNPALHAFMIEQGAAHDRIEALWKDIGDAENGPDLIGHPSFDLYLLDDVEYVMDEHGCADRCPAPPPFDTQGIECDAVTR